MATPASSSALSRRSARARTNPSRRFETLWALFFLAPSLLGILIFVAGPILMSVLISFTDWRLASPLGLASLRENWVGLGNYIELLRWKEASWSLGKGLAWRLPALVLSLGLLAYLGGRRRLRPAWAVALGLLSVLLVGYFGGISARWDDRRFWESLWNTFYFVLLSVPATIAISMLLAVALNRPLRGVAFYRAAYFMPIISGAVAVALVWRWMFNPAIGPVNQFLGLLGIPGPGWLNSKAWAMPALVITDVWANVGFYMVIFLAGLQAVPQHFYEAADIDGASAWAKFRHVTLPLLSPTTFLNTILALIAAFQVFTLPFIMTGGGPAGATRVLVFYMYERAFSTPFKMGFGSAVAWIVFLILFVLTALQWQVRRKWVVYEE